MSPFVERVTNSFPHVQRTVASVYSGWISVFMVPLIVGNRSTRLTEYVAVLVGLVDLVERIGLRGDQLARHAGGSRGQHGARLGARLQPVGDGDEPERLAVAGERDGEWACVSASRVADHRDVARAGLQRHDLQVGARVGLAADLRGRALGPQHAPLRVTPAEADQRAVL